MKNTHRDYCLESDEHTKMLKPALRIPTHIKQYLLPSLWRNQLLSICRAWLILGNHSNGATSPDLHLYLSGFLGCG